MVKVDPITLEVVENALYAMEQEMEATILRTAMSIVIREVADFGLATLDAAGRLVHGSPMSAQVVVENYRDDEIHEGDVFVFNDPYLSRGEMTHLGDTQLCRPIFWQGRRVAWATVWGHHMDVGGVAASGLPSTTTEIFQEGVQLPPVKLYDRNRLNDSVLKILARNSRAPEMYIGDTLAMAASCTITERRIHELMEKFGVETVLACFEAFAQRAREAVHKVVAGLPDGLDVEFEDCVDDDGVGPDPVRLHVRMTKQGGRLTLDYSGSADQVRGPVNLILNTDRQKLGLWRSIMQYVGHKVGIDPQTSANYGAYDAPMDFIVRRPSVLAPEYPAPVAARHITLFVLRDLMRGIWAQVFPQQAQAASNGVVPVYMLRGVDPRTGKTYLSFECLHGGGGARHHADGIDGLTPNQNLTLAAAEYLEATYPLRVETTSLRCDTGGPGKFRGGAGMLRIYEICAPEAYLSWMDDRQRFPGWGLFGGRAGVPADAYLVKADGRIFQLPTKYDNLLIHQGDRLVVRTGGGGGFGPPWERDPELVRQDVRRGYVSRERARSDYGVVFQPDTLVVDAAETARLRREMAAAAGPGWVDRGQERQVPPPGRLVQVSEIPD